MALVRKRTIIKHALRLYHLLVFFDARRSELAREQFYPAGTGVGTSWLENGHRIACGMFLL